MPRYCNKIPQIHPHRRVVAASCICLGHNTGRYRLKSCIQLYRCESLMSAPPAIFDANRDARLCTVMFSDLFVFYMAHYICRPCLLSFRGDIALFRLKSHVFFGQTSTGHVRIPPCVFEPYDTLSAHTHKH